METADNNQMQIPEEYQQLCRDLASVLRKFNYEHGWMNGVEQNNEMQIYQFSGKFQINNWKMSDIHFNWENGRHGEDQNNISINTTIRVDTKINE